MMSRTFEDSHSLFSFDGDFSSCELKWVFHVNRELLESTRNATSCRLSRLERSFLHHWWLGRSVGFSLRNGDVLTKDLQVLIENPNRLSPLRERLVL